MNTTQLENIRRHGLNLLAIFPDATERDPVKLCKRLRRFEAQGNALALRLCNGPEFEGGPDTIDSMTDDILRRVRKILGAKGPPIFLNRDPRGYALKIPDGQMRGYTLATDWGGYGLIAPEINS